VCYAEVSKVNKQDADMNRTWPWVKVVAEGQKVVKISVVTVVVTQEEFQSLPQA